MSSLDPRSAVGSHESFVDWDELSGLDRIVSIQQAGTNVILLETRDNREVRVTAWFDRRTGKYVADFERRCTVSGGGQQLRVWAQTPAYARCISDDLTGCLEAAVLEVDRLPVY